MKDMGIEINTDFSMGDVFDEWVDAIGIESIYNSWSYTYGLEGLLWLGLGLVGVVVAALLLGYGFYYLAGDNEVLMMIAALFPILIYGFGILMMNDHATSEYIQGNPDKFVEVTEESMVGNGVKEVEEGECRLFYNEAENVEKSVGFDCDVMEFYEGEAYVVEREELKEEFKYDRRVKKELFGGHEEEGKVVSKVKVPEGEKENE